MHEVSLVSALVDQVEELSRAQGFNQVLTVWLSVGALCGAAPDCLEFCFSEVTRSTVLEGARLVVQRVAVQLVCRQCAEVSTPADSSALFCGACGSADVEIGKGQELRIAELEVQ